MFKDSVKRYNINTLLFVHFIVDASKTFDNMKHTGKSTIVTVQRCVSIFVPILSRTA